MLFGKVLSFSEKYVNLIIIKINIKKWIILIAKIYSIFDRGLDKGFYGMRSI